MRFCIMISILTRLIRERESEPLRRSGLVQEVFGFNDEERY
jgi:hypothetical protein